MKSPKKDDPLIPNSEVDIEAIMAQVREKAQQNRQTALEQGLQSSQLVFDGYPDEPISGSYNPDLHTHLRQVNQLYTLKVRRVTRPTFLTSWPVIGWVWQRVQHEAHNLVIFYVNLLSHEVSIFQRHVTCVLNRLVGWSQTTDKEIILLKEEINRLKERVEYLEARK
jgi:hypothetical protein